MAIWEHEECIRNCLWFRSEVALVFGFMYGVSLTMFFCLIVIFTKLNITSILYMIALYFVYTVQFYPSRFMSSLDAPDYRSKRESVNSGLRIIIILCSVLILVEYTLITIHNFTKENQDEESVKLEMISKWEEFVNTRLCYLPEKDPVKGQPSACLLDWNNWLEIGKNSIKKSFFAAQFFLLMSAHFAYYFTSTDKAADLGLKILPEPVYGDENDFTGKWAQIMRDDKDNSGMSERSNNKEQQVKQPEKTFSEKFKFYSIKIVDFTVFSAFPFIFMAVMFLSVVQFDGLSF